MKTWLALITIWFPACLLNEVHCGQADLTHGQTMNGTTPRVAHTPSQGFRVYASAVEV